MGGLKKEGPCCLDRLHLVNCFSVNCGLTGRQMLCGDWIHVRACSLCSYHALFLCRHHFRVQAVLLRARFDEHKNENDMVKAKQLLIDGEKELLDKSHTEPIKCM